MPGVAREWRSVDEILRLMAELPEFLGREVPGVNDSGGFGNGPLKIAAVWGDSRAIELLVSSGAKLDCQHEDGYTALHHAVSQGNLDAAATLLRLGASANVKDNFGHLAEDYAETPELLALFKNGTA